MKNIIVREYLESLKEDRELDAIFPILLEAMEFQIITSPKYTKGYQQFGKDVVVVGVDEDGIKKRFYFEIKGGDDKNITDTVFTKNDGVRMSLIEAKDRPFSHNSIPEFKDLPVKIVLVHNGVLRENVRETFDGFIGREFPKGGDFEFEQWDIYKLTELFTNKLFNEYLLTDEASVQHFKKVLVLFGTPRNDNSDFKALVDRVFEKAKDYERVGERGRIMLAETLKLITFIVHTYAADAGNLEPARQCVDYALISYWRWILEHEKENDKESIKNFKRYLTTYRRFQDEYFEKTLPVAKLQFGLWSPNGSRYEQVGYPMRSMKYLNSLLNYYNFLEGTEKENLSSLIELHLINLAKVIENNDATHRPLLDYHSIPISMTLDYFIKNDLIERAKSYLMDVWSSIIMGYNTFKRLPDGNNSVKSVIRFMVTREKSIYYADKTSHLLGILLEYVVVLDLQSEYQTITDFLKQTGIDLAVYIPYTDAILQQMPDIEAENHELTLFSKNMNEEGFQSEINYFHDFDKFKEVMVQKKEFSYDYRTVKAGFGWVLGIAHALFKTPLFPIAWRPVDTPEKESTIVKED